MKSKIDFLIAGMLVGLISSANAALEYPLSVQNISELQSLNMSGITNKSVALVLGYYAPSDRGGGMFQWNSSSTATNDGGRYITTNSWAGGAGRWVRMLNGETANVKMWGATANPVHDDTTNIQYAVNACGFGWTEELLFPSGSYKVTDTIVFPSQLHIRGEGQVNNTHVIMPAGSQFQKDIFRTGLANRYLTGDSVIPGYDLDHGLVFENMYIAFDGVEETRNTSNACLVVCSPGEGNEIRNLHLLSGGYGIRCIGGGAPGLRVRNVSVGNQAIAGISVEPMVINSSEQDNGGSINLSGISGDYRWNSYAGTASLIRLYHSIATVSIHSFKAEGEFGGGVIQASLPAGWPGNPMGSIGIYGGTYSSGPLEGQTNVPRDFVVLKGPSESPSRTPSVYIDRVNLSGTRYLIRDEVTGRNVSPPDNLGVGLMQGVCRLPTEYEGYNYGWLRSRLVVGGDALYTFLPPTNGWYRVMGPVTGNPSIGGRLVISSLMESSEVSVQVYPGGGITGAEINVIRTVRDGGSYRPMVTKIRAGSYNDPSLSGNNDCPFVDIYVERLHDDLYDYYRTITLAYPIQAAQNLIVSGGMVPLLTPTSPLTNGDPLPSSGCTLLQCITNSLVR